MNGVVLFFLQPGDYSDLTGLYSDKEKRDSIDQFWVNAQYDAFERNVSCWENLHDQFEHSLDFAGCHRHLLWQMVFCCILKSYDLKQSTPLSPSPRPSLSIWVCLDSRRWGVDGNKWTLFSLWFIREFGLLPVRASPPRRYQLKGLANQCCEPTNDPNNKHYGN